MFSKSLRSSLTTLKTFQRSISVGAKIPAIGLFEGSPGNSFDLSKAISTGKSVIVGIPGAFSPACSASHVPGYINNFAKFADKGYTGVYVVAVNDAFVTKAWGETLLKDDVNVKFLADPKGEFTEAIDLLFDASKFFGNKRSIRYTLLVEDGKVVKTFVEPDNTSVDVSAAEKVLGEA